jgi:fatty-acyl-CoA synthase
MGRSPSGSTPIPPFTTRSLPGPVGRSPSGSTPIPPFTTRSLPVLPSYASGASTQPLIGETIGANLDRIAATFADREALVSVHQGVRFTYRQFNAEVNRVARALLAMGLSTGDRVGIWSPNCFEWTLVQYATAKLGVILVNINPAYRSHELAYVLNQSGCRALVAAKNFKTSDYVSMVEAVRPDVANLEITIFLDTPDWEALLARADERTDADVAAISTTLQFDDPINIQYTSGTTGFPKGATLTHHNILNNGYFVGEGCKYTEHDRICIPVPLYHCFGMVMGNLGATTHGACMVYPAAAFEPAATLQAVQDEKCTSLYGVPTMFIAELGLAEFETYNLDALRTGIMAGSPCPVEVMKQVQERMGANEVGIAYGMTETSPVSTQTATDDTVDRRCGSVGRVMPHVEVKIIDPETGAVTPRGIPGEFCTRGYSVMSGYWDNPDKTHEAIDTAGWMHTGDLAVMDDEGYVNIVGRIKDMIIRGGENVYPREIEEFLYTYEAVADVQVIGVPDIKYGEEIMAWVKVKEGHSPSEQDIKDFCKGKIAHYKVPRYVKFVEEFPMTVTGKVRKVEMREQSIDELGLQSAAAVKNA